MRLAFSALPIIILLAVAPARADDGYCDYVQGVAAAESAISLSPEVFAQYGRIEQASSAGPTVDPGTLRFIGGIRYRLTGLYEGFATLGRAKADCRRHQAFEAVRTETVYRALEARAKVLEGALPEAEKMLSQVNADFEARRTTAQEANALRIRVEEIRRLAAETRQALRDLPAPAAGDHAGALAAFHRADADVESREAALRRARAVDLSVRFGFDRYLEGGATGSSPYFAVISLGVNLGLLWQGFGNSRAAEGRKRLVRSGHDPVSEEATNALVEATAKRAQDTAALEADLSRQYEALGRVGGEDSKRFRQTVWFDLVKARAERAYNEAYLAALKQVLGS
jgi:hypothetical protein